MATSSRESRRRKIVEKGADRLAFIQGRISTLPANSHDENTSGPSQLQVSLAQDPLPTVSHQDTEVEAPRKALPLGKSVSVVSQFSFSEIIKCFENGEVGYLIWDWYTNEEPRKLRLLNRFHVLAPYLLYISLAVSACAEEEAALPDLPKEDHLAEAGLTNAYEGGVGGEVESHGGETGVEGSTVSALDFRREVEQLLPSLSDQSPSISTSRTIESSEPQTHQHNPFTPKLISSAISLSERIRLFCSITVAILVVLSHLGFPLLSSRIIKSIISFGALYLVILTDLTIVIARLLFCDRGAIERPVDRENQSAPTDGYGWAEQLSKTLELGLVIQKALDAAFMDCGVYAIIIVCGLSFA